jgi:putative thioredoxin
MIALLLDRNEIEAAQAHYALLSHRANQHMAYDLVAARMRAIEVASTLPPREALEERIDHDENDLQARLDLANVFIAHQAYREGMEQLLEIVARDRTFLGDVGRLRLLEVFAMAGDREDLVTEFRGKLSQLLF